MAWIESHEGIARHPKTRKLARLLGCSIPTTVGHLHVLWHWALTYADDGRLSKFDAEDIALACMWEKDPDTLVEVLVETGWLDRTDAGLVIHDWEDYGGKLAEARRTSMEGSARGNHVRWHERRGVVNPNCAYCPDDSGGDRGATPDDSGGDSSATSGVSQRTGPDPTGPDTRGPDPTSDDRGGSLNGRSLVLRLSEACEHKTAHALAEARAVITTASRLLDLGEVERIVTWAERREPAPKRPRIIWKPVRQRALELGCRGVPENWDEAS